MKYTVRILGFLIGIGLLLDAFRPDLFENIRSKLFGDAVPACDQREVIDAVKEAMLQSVQGPLRLPSSREREDQLQQVKNAIVLSNIRDRGVNDKNIRECAALVEMRKDDVAIFSNVSIEYDVENVSTERGKFVVTVREDR